MKNIHYASLNNPRLDRDLAKRKRLAEGKDVLMIVARGLFAFFLLTCAALACFLVVNDAYFALPSQAFHDIVGYGLVVALIIILILSFITD